MIAFITGFIIGFTIIYLLSFFVLFFINKGIYGYARRLLKRMDDISLYEEDYFSLTHGGLYYYYINEDLEIDKLIYFTYTEDFLISRNKKFYLLNNDLKYFDPYYYYLLSRFQKHFKERKSKDILKLNIEQ